jgi:hypothetical protein
LQTRRWITIGLKGYGNEMRGKKSSRYVLSAEGAAFMSKPGATPQASSKSESTSAERAIHFGQQFESTGQLNRAFSARFVAT